MSVLKLVTAPDPKLKKISKVVDKVDDDLRKFMDDMLDTMYNEQGIGLAAVQVGVLKRVIVIDLQIDENSKPYYIVNPEIIERSDEENNYEEGCLSFPGQKAIVKRPKKVIVKSLDYYGKEQIIKCDELLATCIQHEIDHINGVTFVDHISNLKRNMIMKKLNKLKKINSV